MDDKEKAKMRAIIRTVVALIQRRDAIPKTTPPSDIVDTLLEVFESYLADEFKKVLN